VAAEIVVHGLRPGQAALAAELGATAFEVSGANPAAAGRSGRFDLVIEAAGTAAAVESAIALARRGGRVILLGLAGNGVTARFPVDDVVNNDLRISASFAYTSAAWAEVAGGTWNRWSRRGRRSRPRSCRCSSAVTSGTGTTGAGRPMPVTPLDGNEHGDVEYRLRRADWIAQPP
jgi:hypothetical protein